jgi:hypothetical protein
LDFESGKEEDKEEIVSLIRTSKYSTSIQQRLTDRIKKVKIINLNEMNQLDCDSFEPILQHSESLDTLNLSGCINLNGKIISSVVPSIQNLNLSRTKIIDLDLQKFFKNFALLHSIDLSFCPLLTSKFVSFLNFAPLVFLSFSGCPNVSSSVINYFAKGEFKIFFYFFVNKTYFIVRI